MGQYYRPFIKSENRLVKNLPFAENGGLTWIAQLELYEENEVVELSKSTADELGVQVTDFYWLGDYGTAIAVDSQDLAYFLEDEEVSIEVIWD